MSTIDDETIVHVLNYTVHSFNLYSCVGYAHVVVYLLFIITSNEYKISL